MLVGGDGEGDKARKMVGKVGMRDGRVSQRT
jgi:hypothetical protein